MNFPATPPEDAVLVSDAEVVASVGLGLLPGVGPRTVRRWLETAGSAEAVWRALPAFLGARPDRDAVLAAGRSADPAGVVARARARGMAVVVLRDAGYPARLRAIPDPPPALFVRGGLDEAPAVGVVGSRRATPYGLAAAERLAFDLALAGIVVVSGMARGIDGAAHRAALDAGGRTVAVMGCGADVVYPREHRALAEAIAVQGAVVSEFAPGTPPLPDHFPRRNRLISGLALGVVVVEGREESGALMTVDYALDQGREVFAVPGSIFSSGSRAPHALLRQGARLVEAVDDILHELGLPVASPAGAADTPAPPAGAAVRRPSAVPAGIEADLLALLEAGPRQADDLVEASALPAARVAASLTVLELRGLIRTLPGQVIMRTAGGPEAARESRVARDLERGAPGG